MIPVLRTSAASCLLACVILSLAAARQAPQDSTEKPAANSSIPAEPPNPAQIELLETRIRFDVNGDSRKEVHTLVRINSELGVRQFARLNFDYNRSFEAVEIPLVHITHSSGGTADILPSAITDNPNPAVVNYPAYHDVRVKSVRILGLQPGDLLEYRVITTTSHHPLAPDFWLDHSFDRSGVVTRELFELNLPDSIFKEWENAKVAGDSQDPSVKLPASDFVVYRGPQIYTSPQTPENSKEEIGEGETARRVLTWSIDSARLAKEVANISAADHAKSDIIMTTFSWWPRLALKMKILMASQSPVPGNAAQAVSKKSEEICASAFKGENCEEALYSFVSQNIKTVNLPLDSTGFKLRSPLEVLSSGYGTSEEKCILFLELLPGVLGGRHLAIWSQQTSFLHELPRPSLFNRMFVFLERGDRSLSLDPGSEVAPFGAIPANLRGATVLILRDLNSGYQRAEDTVRWGKLSSELPFRSAQSVTVNARLSDDGKLAAKVHYSLRGDNELLLRIAFHKTPKENWKDIAQLLSFSDGFRGKIEDVSASDPYATHDPFTVDYEITIPKFVDWSKKSVQVPALLPQIGLPDPPAKPPAGAKPSPIELGTPLEVTTAMTLYLPPGVSVQVPTGTSVQRDYATFSSLYSAKGQTIIASRHINFLLRQIPADRATDFNAFLHAVQNDQSQSFTITSSAPK